MTFWILEAFFGKYELGEFLKENMPKLKIALYQLEKLIELNIPEIYKAMQSKDVCLELFAVQWFVTLFSYDFEPPHLYMIWDLFLIKGWKFIFQLAIAILQHMKKQFIQLDYENLVAYLKSAIRDNHLDNLSVIKTALNIKITNKILKRIECEYLKSQGIQPNINEQENKGYQTNRISIDQNRSTYVLPSPPMEEAAADLPMPFHAHAKPSEKDKQIIVPKSNNNEIKEIRECSTEGDFDEENCSYEEGITKKINIESTSKHQYKAPFQPRIQTIICNSANCSTKKPLPKSKNINDSYSNNLSQNNIKTNMLNKSKAHGDNEMLIEPEIESEQENVIKSTIYQKIKEEYINHQPIKTKYNASRSTMEGLLLLGNTSKESCNISTSTINSPGAKCAKLPKCTAVSKNINQDVNYLKIYQAKLQKVANQISEKILYNANNSKKPRQSITNSNTNEMMIKSISIKSDIKIAEGSGGKQKIQHNGPRGILSKIVIN